MLPMLVLGQTPTQTKNYVRTKVYKIATTSNIAMPTKVQANQSVTYLDGLGRPLQQVAYQQSATGKNIVLPIEYDTFGRQVKNYLPYKTQTNGLDYESSALTDVLNYTPYQGQNPFSENKLEDSPLNRILKQAAPGTDWAMDAGHEEKFEYLTNVASGAEAVKFFNATSTWDSNKGLYDIALIQTTNYVANDLYKIVIKNQNWTSSNNNTIQEFKNKEGRTVLRRMFDNNVPHDTYYVYDQFGNLTYMIPPKASDVSITTTVLNDLCYQYKYDYRNRLVEKKMPGKQWEFIIYDKLNRVVMTGPTLPPFSNLSNNGWKIIKYDAYNRTVLTGWMSSASTINSALRKIRQDERNAETTNFSESRTASTPDVTISGITFRYSNSAIPTSGYHVLSVNYYDDYNFPDAPVLPTSIEGQPVYYNNTLKPIGLVTGTWLRAISTSTSYRNEKSYILYDYKGRPIRAFVRNHENSPGGYTQIDRKLDFIGKTEYTVTLHKRINSDTGITIKDAFTYSDQDRLLTHTQQINSGSVQLLAANTYDELGHLISKNVGNSINNPLQKIDYTYNIRGWLTGINNVGVNPTVPNPLQQGSDPKDLFAFKINYNTVAGDVAGVTPLYNGNIAETYWRTASDNVLRKYGYQYDNLNRLKNAIYQKPENVNPVTNAYDESLTYDKNGNIITLQRYGDLDLISGTIGIDNLVYQYSSETSNQLKGVVDFSNNSSGFRDNNSYNDYTYDANGNMLTDANKGITVIQYNHQNLPIKIIFGTTGTIEYLYDANGTKLEKTVTQGTTSTNTKYLNGFQYVNNVLQFFPIAEGYVAKVGSAFKYVFQYKDHLGNVRLSYSKNTTTGNLDIIEESHFYPFGLKHTGYNNTTILTSGNSEAQKYKFQEQERQTELGLNWDSFKWRNYDPAIGRFMSVDPLGEKYNWQSNYSFCSNQVVQSREIEGLEADYDQNDYDNYYINDYLDHTGESNWQPAGFDGGLGPMDGQLDEVVVGNSYKEVFDKYDQIDNDRDGYGGKDDDRDGVDQRDDVDAIDVIDYGVSGLGEANNLMRNLWQGSSNASQWRAAYQVSKTLGVGASVIKNGVNPGLKTAGRYLTGAAIAFTAYKVVSTGQVHSSDVLALSMIALGSTGVGAPIATAFFVADLMTLAITGQSIGDHLDNIVGEPLIDFGYGGN